MPPSISVARVARVPHMASPAGACQSASDPGSCEGRETNIRNTAALPRLAEIGKPLPGAGEYAPEPDMKQGPPYL
jgi:hypothetical protein